MIQQRKDSKIKQKWATRMGQPLKKIITNEKLFFEKYKLLTLGLKSYDASVLLDYF